MLTSQNPFMSYIVLIVVLFLTEFITLIVCSPKSGVNLPRRSYSLPRSSSSMVASNSRQISSSQRKFNRQSSNEGNNYNYQVQTGKILYLGFLYLLIDIY